MIHQFVNVTGRIVATERGEMAIPQCIADAEADCGTSAVLPSMPSGENVVLLRKSAVSSSATLVLRDSPSSENQTDDSLSSVTFKQAGKEPARELTIEYLDGNGLGLSCDIERPRAALF
ncbi:MULTISPECIES: hypothetical protein [Bradyrhizobium]|uniref:Uncharacterized protein n=1 Tax=Bradyrhizobium ottawaense TaxID=931866 RepID=A0ABY0P834_9BRAD|nr:MULTISPECIES: hypothetical protein [Bradyrhizobium]SDH64607.1 hypothetical protein SAMN05444163_0626 [Bradyrhizobium ottawaense]